MKDWKKHHPPIIWLLYGLVIGILGSGMLISSKINDIESRHTLEMRKERKAFDRQIELLNKQIDSLESIPIEDESKTHDDLSKLLKYGEFTGVYESRKTPVSGSANYAVEVNSKKMFFVTKEAQRDALLYLIGLVKPVTINANITPKLDSIKHHLQNGYYIHALFLEGSGFYVLLDNNYLPNRRYFEVSRDEFYFLLLVYDKITHEW